MKSANQTIEFELNGKPVAVSVDSQKPLLWVLRDELDLKGTRYGCGMNTCGACTVHLQGQAVRSCVLPISQCQGQSVTTIEGLSNTAEHSVQEAWKMADVPQCGYCQSGQMMQAAAMLAQHAKPGEDIVNANMSKVICRCGTYPRIKKAIGIAAELLAREVR